MINLALPLLLTGLIGGAYYAKTKADKTPPKGVMTPERTVIFQTALDQVKEPGKLRALAKSFREQGLDYEADILEKRAKLRDLPPDVKEARRDAYRKGMASTDYIAVENLASEFEKEGATGAAKSLRDHASGLRAQYIESGQAA